MIVNLVRKGTPLNSGNPLPPTPPPELLRYLEGSRRPLLLAHIYPDGDAVGSALGLAHGLSARGAEPRILITHPAPAKYDFLDPEGHLEVVGAEVTAAHREAVATADLIVILDTSDPQRLGRLEEFVFAAAAPRVVIDHHLCRHAERFDHIWSVTTSPATGSLVLEVLKALQVQITPEIAEALLVAIGTDTGWYQFANTSAEALRASAELVASGANAERIHGAVFETSTLARIHLLGELLAGLRLDVDGRVLYGVLRSSLLERHGIARAEIDGFTDAMKAVGGAEILFLLVELSPGRYKVSLRSKGPVDILGIAEHFGGGGHAKAAGCRLEATEEEALRRIIAQAQETLA